MPMTPDQIKDLKAPLVSSHVKSRKQGGRQVSYVEGWHAIAEANRIFGFDNWTRETTELRMVSEKPRKIGDAQKDGWGVTYIAKVRVVACGVVREGTGAGSGIDVDAGQAHESAAKEAETDAMKRALMTFGNPFGLALYDKEQTNVVDEARQEEPPSKFDVPKSATPLEWANKYAVMAAGMESVSDLQTLAMVNDQWLKKLPKENYEQCMDAFTKRYGALTQQIAAE